MYRALRRLGAFLCRGRLDDELVEEVQLHLDLRRQALIDAGVPAAEAGRQARRQFGNVALVRERARDEWAARWLTSLLQDLRFGLRLMLHHPGMSATVALVIALGAGLNAALFLVVNNALMRAPDLPGADRLVWVDDGRPTLGPTYPDYVDYRDGTSAFSDLATFAMTEAAARIGAEEPREIRTVMASGNYFTVLRSHAALGRTFGPADDLPPLGTPAVVLSDAYWTRRFNRNPDVLGQRLELNLQPFTIVGVMPAGFHGPPDASGNPHAPEVWVPLWCKPQLQRGDRALLQRNAWWGLRAIGRLHDGVTVDVARAQIRSVAAALDAAHPGERPVRTPWVVPINSFDTRILRGEPGAVIAVLGTVSMFVLVIACANVAGLLLARASARRKEIAVRLSLGAGRGRIIRQFLIEGLLLAAVGTALGYLAAASILGAVLSSGGTESLAWSFWPDRRLLAFASLLAVVAAMSTGLMPALQASKTALLPALTRSDAVRVGRLRTVLVGVEVAVCVVLLLASALLLQGSRRAHTLDPGLPVRHLLTLALDARLHGYEGEQLEGALRDVQRAIESVPGVSSTALVTPAPHSSSRHGTTLRLATAPDAPGARVSFASVSSSFFTTTDLPIVRGRALDDRVDDEIVINETLAARLWPSADPLGALVTSGDFDRRTHVVVGVVRDVPYVSLRQRDEAFMFRSGSTGTILVRTAGPAAALVRSVTSAAIDVDRRFQVTAHPLTDGIASELAGAQNVILAAGGLAGLALLLALAGVAATAAQSVTQRRHEIGVRMALGARRLDAVALIVRRALAPVVFGSVLGLVLASQASRVLVSQLYGVSRLDAAAFIGSALVILAGAALAAWVPARRAASIDPIQALRVE